MRLGLRDVSQAIETLGAAPFELGQESGVEYCRNRSWGGQLVLTWTASAGTDYSLERATTLIPVADWTNVPEFRDVHGRYGLMSFTNAPGAPPPLYFRVLGKP